MHPTSENTRRAANTAIGILSIVFWSTTVAFSRRLTEPLGAVTAGAAVYVVGGLASIILLAVRPGMLRAMLRLPRRYLAGCGSLFVAYTALLYWSIGNAADRQAAIEVGVVNYLWPSCTILFSVPILRRRAGPWLLPGVVLALAGVVLAMVQTDQFTWAGLWGRLSSAPGPYIAAAVGAVLWGLYTNLSRRWAGHAAGGAVPLFFVASGLTLVAMAMLMPEHPPRWSGEMVGTAVYMGLFPGLVGYFFWDVAVRRGHIIVIASLSYFIPLLSTLTSCLVLGVPMRTTFWLACCLLIAGAWLCNRSVGEKVQAG